MRCWSARKLMAQHNVPIDSILGRMSELETEGKTAMLTAVDGQYAGLVAVADTIKETSRAP